MKKLFITIIALVLAGQLRAAETLEGLKAKYEKAKATIEAQEEAARGAALAAYGGALSASLAEFKKQGDLDSYTTVNEEKTRFTQAGTVPASTNSANSHVQKAAEAYEKSVKTASDKAGDANVNLLRFYVPALKQAIKSYMMSDKMDEAAKVKSELDKAEFVLADLESRQPRAEPVTPSPDPAVKPPKKPVPVSHRVPVIGSSMTVGKWKKKGLQLKKGDKVSITAKAGSGLKEHGYRRASFWVRFGNDGPQYSFDTRGNYTFAVNGVPRHSSKLETTVPRDGNLHVHQNQDKNWTITVTVTPEK